MEYVDNFLLSRLQARTGVYKPLTQPSCLDILQWILSIAYYVILQVFCDPTMVRQGRSGWWAGEFAGR